MDDAIRNALDLAQRKLTNKAPYGVIDMGDKIILGAPHGQPIELSDELKRRVQEVAGKHGAWYEGDAKDTEAHKNLISNPKTYRGSWDDAVAQSVKGYPVEYLAPLFSNVEVNKQHEMFENPQQTIFDSLLANQHKARYFKDRDYDKNTLTNFLKQGSEKDTDLMRMAASPATKENLQKFFSTGEKLMWPDNWQEYPNKLGQIAKRFEESRNKFLRDAGPGVYIAGAGHIPELKNTYKDLNVIGGERAGYANGGVPFPPRRPVEFAEEDASRAFPGIWKNVNPIVKINMGRQGGYAETYPPRETGDPKNPRSIRPKEFGPAGEHGRTGIEVYRPEMTGSDLALELLHSDPNAFDTRAKMLSLMSPEQMEELRRREDYKQSVKDRLPQQKSYENAMDAAMRSYLANKRELPHSQGPASDIEYMQYTDAQKQHLDKLYNYMMSGKYAEGGSVVEDALRLTRQMGGETSDEMIERGEWSPFSGLKYRPAPEKLSSEPDIREYQLKRHAHEFEGAPEPVAPKRKVVIDAPLFGGKKELGNLPYDYADMANTVLNTLYGFKTAPLYSNPYTAPVGRALDAYETAKKIEEDPSAFSSYTAIPKLFKGATPLGLGAMGVGATIAAEDEENKAYGGAVAEALRVANKRLKGGRINTKIDRDPDWDMGLWHGGTARR